MDEQEREHLKGAANRDLYCLQCGYNLRGLAGDPRRCPECGHDNPMSELTLPAGSIRRHAARMESAAARCVGAFLISLTVAVVAFVADLDEFKMGVVAIPLIASAVWLQGAASFCNLCMSQRGWARGLALYHLYSTVAAAFVPAVLLGGGALLGQALDGCSAVVLVFGTTGLCIWAGAKWVRSRLRAALAPLQREAAVRMLKKQ